MGRRPCCAKEGLNRGAWTAHEDKILTDYIKAHGEGQWRNLPQNAGLKRCGKSCRLRWVNYLRPDIKRGNISPEEEDLIIKLHKLLGNRWSLIAGRLPGRTDNEIKNYWNTKIGRKLRDDKSLAHTCRSHSKKPKQKIEKNVNTQLSLNTGPKSPSNMGSLLVRPKAIRCSKVLVTDPHFPKNEHRNTNMQSSRPSMEPEISVEMHMESSKYNDLLLFDDGENDLEVSIMDFDVEEFCLLDLLDDNNNNGLLPSPAQPLMFSDETLQSWTLTNCVKSCVASNLSNLASFLVPEGDFLRE